MDSVAASVSRTPNSDAEYRQQVGRRVRLARTGRGLGQGAVAESAGVSRNFVSAVERGTQGLDAWRLRQLAAALGVSFGWLLGESECSDR